MVYEVAWLPSCRVAVLPGCRIAGLPAENNKQGGRKHSPDWNFSAYKNAILTIRDYISNNEHCYTVTDSSYIHDIAKNWTEPFIASKWSGLPHQFGWQQ